MKFFLFNLCIVLLLSGCYSSKIVSNHVVDLTVKYENVPKPEKPLIIPVTAFIVKAAADYLIDEISDEFDKYAKAHIEHYKIDMSVEELYSEKTEKKIDLIFRNKENKESFKLPFLFQMGNVSSAISFDEDKSEKSTTFFFKNKKEKFKGIATISLNWKTLWRENNKSFEKVLFDDKVITFSFSKEGSVKYIYPESSDNKKSIMAFPPYSIINNKASKSRHFLTFTATLINIEESKIVRRLAKAYKDERGNIKSAIVDAYKELGEEKD